MNGGDRGAKRISPVNNRPPAYRFLKGLFLYRCNLPLDRHPLAIFLKLHPKITARGTKSAKKLIMMMVNCRFMFSTSPAHRLASDEHGCDPTETIQLNPPNRTQRARSAGTAASGQKASLELPSPLGWLRNAGPLGSYPSHRYIRTKVWSDDLEKTVS